MAQRVEASRSVTRLSGVRSLARLKQYWSIPGFRIGGEYPIGDPSSYEFGGEGGITLESLGAPALRTACITAGTPECDESGRITNAVLISPYYSGDAAWMYYFWHDGQAGCDFSLGPLAGPGKLLDTDRFYVVFLDALGLWGTSKPSDGLGMRFPRYTLCDCVQANYLLLRDHLNVGRVRLAVGPSMGAMQSYLWALLHPDYVDAIMPIGGSTAPAKDPVLRWIFDLMSAAVMSDPVWRETQGDYYHLPKKQHPNRGVMFGWSILMHNGMDLDFRIQQGWNEVRKEVFAWNPEGDQGTALRDKARDFDANDLLLRNAGQARLDFDDFLPHIKAKTLILHVNNDLWLRCGPAGKSAELIPGAKFASFDSPLAHYAVFRAPHVLSREVLAFFKEIGLK